MAFPLMKQVFQTIVETQLGSQSFQIIPGSSRGFEVGEDHVNDVCEIGLSQKHYLRLFLEGHKYFRNEESTEGENNEGKENAASEKKKRSIAVSSNYKAINVKSMGDTDLFSCYLATLSMLSTTHEYSSVWTLHEKVVVELQKRRANVGLSSSLSFVECDYKYMLALATSRLEKINKSSMLWHWIRRLSVQVIFSNFDSARFLNILHQILRSTTLHLANYSASYTFLWMVQMAQLNGYSFDVSAVLAMVRKVCRASLGDISLWTLYGKLLSKPLPFSLKFYNDSAKALGIPMLAGDVESIEPLLKEADALDDIKWLLAIKCDIESPYMQVVSNIDVEKVELLSSGVNNSKLEQVLRRLNSPKCD